MEGIDKSLGSVGWDFDGSEFMDFLSSLKVCFVLLLCEGVPVCISFLGLVQMCVATFVSFLPIVLPFSFRPAPDYHLASVRVYLLLYIAKEHPSLPPGTFTAAFFCAFLDEYC